MAESLETLPAQDEIPSIACVRKPLVAVLAAVVLGIVSDRIFTLGLSGWLLAAVVSWLAWGCVSKLCSSRESNGCKSLDASADRRSRLLRFRTILLLLSILFVTAAWHQLRWRYFGQDDLGFRAATVRQPAALRMLATGYPRRIQPSESDLMNVRPADVKSLLDVQLLAVRDKAVWQSASGHSQLVVKGELRGVAPGDEIEVFASIQVPTAATNPGGFSYYAHQRSYRRLVRITANHPSAVVVTRSGNRWNPRWLVAGLRHHGQQQLWSYLPKRHAELAAALLLGDRHYLGRQRTEAFMRTGTIHLLAISGLHVTILAFAFYLLARLAILPPRVALFCVMMATLTYMLLSGCRAPVIRATILVYVVCLGQLLRRESVGFNSLAAAGLVVLAWNPCQLFQTGAQLSFLAVAAMMWYLPNITARRALTPIERLIARRRSYPEVLMRIGLRSVYRIAIAGLVIWCVSLPLVMSRFHLVSPVGLVLNMFLWIPVAVALLSGFGVLLFGWWCPPIANLCGWTCSAAIGSMELCVFSAATIPGGHFWVAGPPLWAVTTFYLLLTFFICVRRLRVWWPVWTSVAYLVVLGACWMHAGQSQELENPSLCCTFLSVGHGCGTVIEFPSGEVWIYDAGSLGSSSHSLNVISNFLWSRGITHVDAVFLSHADVDHYNAMPGIVRRFGVSRVFVPPAMFAADDATLSVLRDSLDQQRIPIEELAAGDVLSVYPFATAEVLNPPADDEQVAAAGDNARSIVIRLRSFGRTILLTGDVESTGLDRLLAQEPLKCDVAMAPHHGSVRSTPKRFCQWCSPDAVIVSAGLRQTPSAGVAAYEAAGCRVFHTAVCGAVRVSLSRDGVQVRPYLSDRLAKNFP